MAVMKEAGAEFFCPKCQKKIEDFGLNEACGHFICYPCALSWFNPDSLSLTQRSCPICKTGTRAWRRSCVYIEHNSPEKEVFMEAWNRVETLMRDSIETRLRPVIIDNKAVLQSMVNDIDNCEEFLGNNPNFPLPGADADLAAESSDTARWEINLSMAVLKSAAYSTLSTVMELEKELDIRPVILPVESVDQYISSRHDQLNLTFEWLLEFLRIHRERVNAVQLAVLNNVGRAPVSAY